MVTWSDSIYCIGLRSQVYGSFLREFPTSNGDIVVDEHNFSSPYGWLVREDDSCHSRCTGINNIYNLKLLLP